jgi:squalene-hopene/tetraprenyl-beta-curcumene cyclase
MKRATLITVLSAAAAVLATAAPENRYASLQQEIAQATKRGNAHLATKFTKDGYLGSDENPAITALAVRAALMDPSRDRTAKLPDHLERALTWLLSTQKDDGGFYTKGLGVYNTALTVTTLVAAQRPEYDAAIIRARRFLVNQQSDFDARGEADNKYDGGIGYGGTYSHSDMSNTHLAMEAMHASEKIVADGKHGDQPDLDWAAALKFVSRTQNLEETNDLEFASNDPDNKGGFVYYPGDSKAGEQTLPNGRVALRSYGSMTYAGLLSFIYADMKADDPRIVTLKEWLSRNYTVDENPNMGAQGLYYYFHTMAKGLAAANIDKLPLADGKTADWRNDLAVKVLNTQREDGSWVNQTGRWMESDSELVTSYSLLTLAQIHHSIPK